MSNLLFHVIGAVAEFERSLIRERQREGIAAALAKGKRWGRKPSLTKEQEEAAKNMVADGHSVINVAKEFEVSRYTIYRVINEEKKKRKLKQSRNLVGQKKTYVEIDLNISTEEPAITVFRNNQLVKKYETEEAAIKAIEGEKF